MNTGGEVWLGERIDTKPHTQQDVFRWQMPQGGIDPGEAPEDAARRELFEETGVRSAHLLCMTPGWLLYEFPEEYRRRKKKEKWRGQRQKWALMLFHGDDAEIDLTADMPQEFSDWRWGTLEEALELIVPFKRAVYEEVALAFSPLAEALRRGSIVVS